MCIYSPQNHKYKLICVIRKLQKNCAFSVYAEKMVRKRNISHNLNKFDVGVDS